MILSIATIALKLQTLWIYTDAGYGKYTDPLQGWTWNADPLPALDTYARHTFLARVLYTLLRPSGLRLITPTVVWVELLSVPMALVGSFLGWRRVLMGAVGLCCSLHLGIAGTVRNTILLSLVACSVWCVFLPPPLPTSKGDVGDNATNGNTSHVPQSNDVKKGSSISTLFRALLILSFISGSVWFETMSESCDQSMKHIWSTLLHNRWNVFVGAEEYVTWEIAPGRISDGSIVDVWSKNPTVHWNMPGTGAPCTSTSRPGRWRSFPYLAGLKGEDGEALWSYLCHEWDRENNNGVGEGGIKRRLLRFNFFMLQADVLPNMAFSETRKRLIHSFDCTAAGGRGEEHLTSDDKEAESQEGEL